MESIKKNLYKIGSKNKELF